MTFIDANSPRQDLEGVILAEDALYRRFDEQKLLNAASVLDEGPGFELPARLAVSPNAKLPAVVGDAISVDAQSLCLKRYPAKGLLASKTRTETRAAFGLVPRRGELPANGADRRGRNAEFVASARAKVDEVEGGRPASINAHRAAALSLALSRYAEIPDVAAMTEAKTSDDPRALAAIDEWNAKQRAA
jgi:hypothetical protein